MVIDAILDRKEGEEYGEEYNAKAFYDFVRSYGKIGEDITLAMDYGEEEDVKAALCDYIIINEYNPALCDYIETREWLPREYAENR